jgi:t-SNARE complex subunit (syntaxin)
MMLVDTTQLEIAVLEDREGKVRQLEADVLDLNSIMLRMAEMTEEQGEQITEIDKNVEASVEHVEEGTTQLQLAIRFANQRRRWVLGFLILGVVLLILLVSLV